MPPSLLDSQLATLERPGTGELALPLDASLPTGILCERIETWLAIGA
jgi:gluconokinase